MEKGDIVRVTKDSLIPFVGFKKGTLGVVTEVVENYKCFVATERYKNGVINGWYVKIDELELVRKKGGK